MQHRSFGNTLKNLLLALLNATLILLALCLFFAWQLAKTVNSTTTEIADSLVTVEPLRAEVNNLTTEVKAMRADLQTIQSRGSDASSDALRAVQTRIDAIDARITTAVDKVEAVVAEPEVLIDFAIDQAAEQVKLGVEGLLQCKRPEA